MSLEEPSMATAKKPSTHEQADAEEIMRLVSAGKQVTDPVLIRRDRERAEKTREEVVQRHRTVEWFVELIRESRDE
jgi:hypothetical protein